MKTAEEWVPYFLGRPGSEEDTSSPAYREVFTEWIRAIQSDASRSAARSERERCARVCDEQVQAARFLDESSGLAELCRNRIRALPDVPGEKGDGL